MTIQFRLIRLASLTLEPYTISQSPPYIAASHAWSDQVFAPDLKSSFGLKASQKIISNRFPTIQHCWIDNFCIKQDDENDKIEQIPLMGDIYRNAEAVAIILKCEIGFHQAQVDNVTVDLQDIITGWHEEEFTSQSFIQHWTHGEPRQIIVRAMRGLSRLTRSPWATRIWTLQEYILASNIIWIGAELEPVTVNDELFQALPDLCNRLTIQECWKNNPEFEILHTHFSGMANSRMRAIDRTRTMEILGNRQATVPVDEIYGIMACCGVVIEPEFKETREKAWERWCIAAISKGHIRWLLMPPMRESTLKQSEHTTEHNCIIPPFSTRHLASSASHLDHVAPLGPISVVNGTIRFSARAIGTITLLRRLGSVHAPSPEGILYNDITLILLSHGRWTTAKQIIQAFSAGRYSTKQIHALCQVLLDSYPNALSAVLKSKQANFRPKFRTQYHYNVWADFIQFTSQCTLPGLNMGCGYLARINIPQANATLTTVVIMHDGDKPSRPLIALDLKAETSDERYILLVAELPLDFDTAASLDGIAMHKVGTTIPVSNKYRRIWDELSLAEISMGGTDCHVCCNKSQGNMSAKQGAQAVSMHRMSTSLRKIRVASMRVDMKSKFELKMKTLRMSRDRKIGVRRKLW